MLNLAKILSKISNKKGNKKYFEGLSLEIEEYCKKNKVCYNNYFYHEKLVAEKVGKK